MHPFIEIVVGIFKFKTILLFSNCLNVLENILAISLLCCAAAAYGCILDIISLYLKYGPNWALISRYFDKKRTNNSIKNRWNNHLKKDYKNISQSYNDEKEHDIINIMEISKESFDDDFFILNDIETSLYDDITDN